MSSPVLGPYEGSALNFVNFNGKTLAERYHGLNHWGTLRDEQMIWPYGKIHDNRRPLNFGTQDYLGLSHNQEAIDFLKDFLERNNIVHSAGSPTLTGRTIFTEQLEQELALVLKQGTCLVYPTGWMACFGAVSGLANSKDTIIIDSLAHNCLQLATKCTTPNVHKFHHNKLDHLQNLLEKCRQQDNKNGLFIITESLFSMNSDSPDIKKLIELSRRYEAIVIIDTAHDFGVTGKNGLGLIGDIPLEFEKNIVICGAFSKAFGTNGGFVAGPPEIRKQLTILSPTYIFSTGASPIQCAIALNNVRMVFSESGNSLRERLSELVDYTVTGFKQNGFTIIGKPTQIVPVLIGHERVARHIFRHVYNEGLMINLIEFPAVPKGKAIFRFQLMATHKEEEIDRAIHIIREAQEKVKTEMQELID